MLLPPYLMAMVWDMLDMVVMVVMDILPQLMVLMVMVTIRNFHTHCLLFSLNI